MSLQDDVQELRVEKSIRDTNVKLRKEKQKLEEELHPSLIKKITNFIQGFMQ